MKRLLFPLIWLVAVCARAAVPTFESFSTNQFQTNSLQIFYRDPHTNDAGIIYPAIANTLTLVTNENVYGTFSLPAKVTLLTLGTNYLDLSTNSTWLLNSPTNDAAQVIISLSAGAYQGQLLFVTSQNGSNSFTLPDLSEQWDVPGAYVDIQGDWVGTTNRGIILQYTAPDWIEMARFDPGQTGGGTVFGSGTVPNFPYWITPTTLGTSTLVFSNAWNIRLDSTNTTAAGKFLIQGPSGSALMDITGDGTTAHFQGGSVGAYLANAAGIGVISLATAFVPTVNNTMDLGASGSLRWKNFSLDGHINWNGSTNSVYDLAGAGSPEGVVTASLGSFYRDYANGTFYGKTNGVGNTGWGILLAGSGTAALWSAAGGVLEPNPAIDLVRIESQLADNATNIAFIVDTTAPWTNTAAKLLSLRSSGTNQFTVATDGGIMMGRDVETWWGGPPNGMSLLSFRFTDLGDFDNNEIFIGVGDSTGGPDTSFDVYGNTAEFTMAMASFHGPGELYGMFAHARTNGIVSFALSPGDGLGGQPSANAWTALAPTITSSGSATAYKFDTANLLQSGDLVADFSNSGTNVLSIDSGGGILSGRGITTVDPAYSFRSSHNQALGENQFNTLYIEDTVTGNYTNWAAANLSTLAPAGASATSANLLMQSTKAGKAGEFEVALNSDATDSTSSFVRLKVDTAIVFFANNLGVKTAAPPTDTAAPWRFGSEQVISTVTNLIVSVNGVKYSVVATPR